jgi:hypothetical protein
MFRSAPRHPHPKVAPANTEWAGGQMVNAGLMSRRITSAVHDREER